MMRFEPRRPINLMYATRGFRSGQTVTVTVYDSNGNEALASSSMTELGSTGVYKKRFTPGKSDTYFAIADCTEYPRKDFTTLVVGGKPGDFALGGFIPKLPPSVWTEKEKKLTMKVVSKLYSELQTIKENQLNTDSEISKVSSSVKKSRKELDSKFIESLDSFNRSLAANLISINKTVEKYNKAGLANLSNDILETQNKLSVDLKSSVDNFLAKLTFMSKEEVAKEMSNISILTGKLKEINSFELIKELSRFSLLADELNVTLAQMNLDKSKIDINRSLSKLSPQVDELLLSLRNLNRGS